MERYLWTNGAIRVSEANEFCEMSEQESDIVRWVSMKKWGEADGSISYTTTYPIMNPPLTQPVNVVH